MRTQDHVFSLARVLLLALPVAASCAVPDSNVTQAQNATNTESSSRALGSNYPANTYGHSWVTKKAFEYLGARGLLPDEFKDSITQDQVLYGVSFADEPWMGRWGAPGQPVHNHMTYTIQNNVAMPKCPIFGAFPVCPIATTEGKFHFDVDVTAYPDATVTSTVRPFTSWFMTGENKPSVALIFGLPIEVFIDKPWPASNETKKFSFGQWAQDNLYHYGHSDLALLGDSSIAPTALDLRLYPFEKEDIPMDGNDGAKQSFVDRLKGDRIITGSDFGVSKYGAILYQLARKFFENSHAEPNIGELIRAGNDVPGWHTGGMRGDAPLTKMVMDFPHTYLGGMPYICAGSNSADPCSNGTPTWPVWVPEVYDPSDPASFLASLQTAYPGRSNRVAAIYMGWALHMIQDASMPHHAANWVGKQHDKQDDFGQEILNTSTLSICANGQPPVQFFLSLRCTDGSTPSNVSVDEFMSRGLDEWLGSPSSPKNINDICDAAGLDDSQVVEGSLNWEAVHQPFLDSLRTAFHSRKEFAGMLQGALYLRSAVHASVKLLLCAPPRTISPALVPLLSASH